MWYGEVETVQTFHPQRKLSQSQRTLGRQSSLAEAFQILERAKKPGKVVRFERKTGWDEYAKARATAKDKKWFRHPGIDVRGPEKRDDPFWTHMRRFYVYDPLPTLQTMNAPLLAVFGELDTPEGVKANVRAIRQILDQAGRQDYTVKVYPNGTHNLMEVPPDNPNEFVRLKRFPPGLFETMVDWTTTQLRRRAEVGR